MRGWYSIHDYENLQIGFVPFKKVDQTPSKPVPVKALTTPTIDLIVAGEDFALGLTETEFWLFIGSLLSVIVVILVLRFCFQSVSKYSAKVTINKRAKIEKSETEVTLIYLE